MHPKNFIQRANYCEALLNALAKQDIEESQTIIKKMIKADF